MKSIKWLFILVLFAFGCDEDENPILETEYIYDFSASAEGWTGDFSDYRADDPDLYELEFEWTGLPEPLDTTENALMIAGSNRSDDLFMFIKREVNNLPPNTDFQVFFDIEMASIYPTNAVGIGGPPGESVYIKAGAMLEEPKAELNASDFYQMNIDKGNQSQSGANMEVIGHVGVTDTTSVYTLIDRGNAGKPFAFRSDATGSAWICIGTDSGFEGRTRLYYNKVNVIFQVAAN